MHQLVALAFLLTLGAHKTKIAVLDVQDVSSGQAEHARLLTQIITGEVGRDKRIEVVSSAQIREMLGFEKQKQLLGCGESSCLAEIGGALGVDYLLTGQLGKIGTRYRLDLSLIDQKKAATVATRGDFLPGEEDALADAAVSMVNGLLEDAGLRSAAGVALEAHSTTAVSHTKAYVTYGIAAGLLVAAGVMTGLTVSAYNDTKAEYQANPTLQQGQSTNGKKLAWMSPLTDGLWAAGLITAGVGTYLYFSASPAGSGGEVGMGGRF